MSERSVTVKMGADVGQYKRAMGEAQASTAKFAADSGRSLESVSAKMGSVGKTMTTKLTLPLLAVGAGAMKLSMDFDASMSKITALVGIGAEEVAGMRDAVLELSGSTATAPQELSEALFVLTSAGLRGDDAMSALEASAKASAAGLGQTNDIARAVAGAMNAYGPEALDAARATDILTATARAGNFETSQLAGALGRVLPFAKQAGASFEDVGGAVALLTRTNGNAAESITQVQALMRSFVVPTAEAATILGELGMSAEDVRTSIGENGLAATLQMLDGKLGGNREQLGRLIGSSEGASAAFQILDADADTIASTFGTVADSVGMTDEAFGTMAETGAFKLKQAWVDVQAALIEVGGIIAPVAADVAEAMARLVSAFAELPAAGQIAVVVIGGIVAAAGPALVITSKLITSFVVLKGALAGISLGALAPLAVAAGPWLAAAAAIGAIGGAFFVATRKTDDFAQRMAEARARIVEVAEAMSAFDTPTDYLTDQLTGLAAENEVFLQGLERSGMSIPDLASKMGVLGGNFDQYRIQVINAAIASGATDEEWKALRDTLNTLNGEAIRAEQLTGRVAAVTGEAGDAADGTAEAVDGQTDAVEAGTEALEGHADATMTAREQLEEIIAAQAEFTAAVLDSIASTFDHEKSTYALADASADLAQKTRETNLIMLDSNRTDEEKAQALRDLRMEQIGVIEQALKTADAYSEETGASVGSAKQVQNQIDALIALSAQHPELQGDIDATIAKMLAVPGTVDSRIDVETAAANEAADAMRRKLEYLNGYVARTFVVNTISNVTEYRTLGAPNRAGTPDGRLASGGPAKAGRLYEVGEGNVAEMFMSGGKQYMIPGNDGNVIPGSKLTPAPQGWQSAPPGGLVGAGAAAVSGPTIQIGEIKTYRPQGVRQELEAMMWKAGAR